MCVPKPDGHLGAVVAVAAVPAIGAGLVMFAEAIASLTWVIASAVVFAAAAIVTLAIRGNRRAVSTAEAVPRISLRAEPVQAIARPAQAISDSPTLPLPRVRQNAIEAPAVHYHVHFHGESSPARAQTGEEL